VDIFEKDSKPSHEICHWCVIKEAARFIAKNMEKVVFVFAM
jgi:hypothetical protein